MEERLQKILARAGFGSRRACEELIRQGRVQVNGQTARIGQRADPDRDLITVDGKPLRLRRRHTYVVLNKPVGVLSDEGDGSGRLPAARELVPLPGHLFPVGRLDLRSEGLLLLTDDGELANRLTHPRYAHEREYLVLVEGEPDQATLERWREGVFLDGRPTAPAQVTIVEKAQRKRQIRRVAAMLGHPVLRLIRVRIGTLRLGDLRPGEWRTLTVEELRELRSILNETQTGARNDSCNT
jgi:23S rRNA pseudouridine2605 synthase